MVSETLQKSRDFGKLLRENGLKVTPHRLRVLTEITQKDAAISQPDLEKIVGKDIDRVTLYRILSSFEEKGIVHKIFDLHGTATYAICTADCTENHHHDQHVHFICSVCNSVYCLDEVSLPKIGLPPDFTLHAIALNAVGLCAHCQKAQK
ncbi:Fur family ferric uptake transcriptional regulator [Sphingobacterium allocomposti]|uniref:Fur family ferric uptake transcriptional regulator n=1 Tax=Sphingobacterium allocomposti TaxID=415956 RepID=A0A5S5DNX2_9SPHI|nr:transcriptional repressor [Sphingobacterium composti Yoo et al. 2007 non Ten et al. 2007]TYP97643.1 Fur family ferric uptake transcriptional regulator [Sphingobacterium composti Yoo et al. 2007 non Ten et al. 2007]